MIKGNMMKKPIVFILILCCGQLNAHTDTFYYQNKHISVIDAGAEQHDFIRVKQTVFADMDTKETYMTDGKNIAFTLGGERQIHSVDYDPYGENQYTHSLFSYNQTYQDPTTALLYLHARDYAPSDERFISMDSYDVWNKYNFADANPIMKIDPSGHLSKSTKKELYFWGFLTLGIVLGVTGQKMANDADRIAPNENIAPSVRERESQARVIKRKVQARGIQLTGIAAVVDANSIPQEQKTTTLIASLFFVLLPVGLAGMSLIDCICGPAMSFDVHEPQPVVRPVERENQRQNNYRIGEIGEA